MGDKAKNCNFRYNIYLKLNKFLQMCKFSTHILYGSDEEIQFILQQLYVNA